MLVVSLVTRGSPAQVTGGHLYHRRMAEAAPSRDAVIEFVSTSGLAEPAARRHTGSCSSTASPRGRSRRLDRSTLIGDRLIGRRRQPIAAILHQPPGGVGQGSVRTALQRPMDKALYRRCELLIVASTALGHELADVHGLPAERICVVEPGSDVPVDRSTRSSTTRDDLRRGRRIALLSVGNWLPNKGVLELLEAFATLPADHATLHLAGRADLDPGYAARVQARLLAPDLASRVVVHGVVTREEVGRLYAGADVFALLSYAETYGTVFGEALAAGVPTVGWRSGNLPNLIEDGREGCLDHAR